MLFALMSACAYAQHGTVKGKVLDRQTDESLEFVNIKVSRAGEEKLFKGAITDVEGSFSISGLPNGNYVLTVSFVGYRNLVRRFAISSQKPTATFSQLYIAEDTHALQEVTVTGQRSAMKLEVDRKSFDVDQQIANAGGSASEVLENIPSVEVDQDGQVSLRGNTSVEVWINGKASGLTTDNRAEILQQMPAESIERIEIIDNPSAKFSAEGSAGIINIVLKRNRKAGYYGSVQAGANTMGGANSSANINYSSGVVDAYANVGYRHRQNKLGGSMSYQEYLATNEYQQYEGKNHSYGNNLFARAGLTLHATKHDDFGANGMLMIGGNKNLGWTPYHYGIIGQGDTRIMQRNTRSRGDMRMMHGELNYRHTFQNDRHYIDLMLSMGNWHMDNDNVYRDRTEVLNADEDQQTAEAYQYLPAKIRNRSTEVKLDYENPISEKLKLQAGYNARFGHENTPMESFVANNWDGQNLEEDKLYFNRFIYDNAIHALYSTLSLTLGKFGIMGGLRGEYWRVNTESYTWEQEHDPSKREPAFKKDYFQLFPSIFMSYQLTDNDQLQLNWTRRLRRPWGGELNSFRNTRDASMVSFGNPELTPEFSNSYSLNYLRTWAEHSFLLSAYYRPTTDVIQRIRYQSETDGLMYQTSRNLSKSVSTGLELTMKNKLFAILDVNTNINFYYYKLYGFSYNIMGQTVSGESDDNFTWNARMQLSLRLPYDISVQATGNYRAKQVITQGYRKANYGMDFGVRKNFFEKKVTLSVNCRDLLDSRRWEIFTSSDTFTRHQKNWRSGRRFFFTLSYNFGNMKQKRADEGYEQGSQEDSQQGNSENTNNGGGAFGGGGEE